ncbi:glycoside hydrolase family protein [Flavobacterium sp. ASV13]|uniref:glycoside hydrolase family protein n=1 Tax=Flavobacterium sp. ASV13 TaxID=1506583 RepID=UPI00068E88A8|nr:glycoside hydrolase family protein [Flavobacterium sp. ASV13]
MSDFKIIGNPNPVVGVLEIFTVSDFFEKAQNSPFSEENSFSYNPVFWEVYVLELGKWRKTKENDKRGNKVSYTFLEKSLTRNGIRILARKGDKVARLDIKPLSAQPKIDHIELLDKNGSRIKGRLSYGQTVKARVFCLNMERRRVSVTMWEDDVKGAGHNKANEKNFIETLSGIVKFGKADIDFLLKPSFAKIAERGGHEKDKIHEFYVTAEYKDGKIASNNINVNALETPVAPYKGKTTPHQAVKNKTTDQKPKNDSQKPNVPTATKAVKGKINAVHITDINGNQIKGKFREKQIKVLINSTGLAGKEVCLKLYDDDLVSNDLLFTDNFTIKSDFHIVTVQLDTIPRSLGGSNWAEGNEQELFTEIEVLQTHDFIKSAVVDVDATVFKQDPVETINNVLKVDVAEDEKDEKENNCGEKYCIKKGDKSELIREINIRLAGFGGNVPTNEFTDRTEKMIKQFQRDYMKVPETGKVCGNVLVAIDDFSEKFDISNKFWEQIKCSCGTKNKKAISKLRGIEELNSCGGFGDHTGKGTYGKHDKTEAYHRYEYPGIHRSLLFGIKALQFYFSKQDTYKIDHVTSGYRCRFKNYSSTNHQGKAIDIQFSKGKWEIRGEQKKNLEPLRDIRDSIYIKYLGAQKEWPGDNVYSIEPIDLLYDKKGNLRYDHTFSWIHMDVREFDSIYLEDKYFSKSSSVLNGKSIIQTAKESGFDKTCTCLKGFAVNSTNKETRDLNKRVDPKTLKTSKKGIEFIKGWEGTTIVNGKHVPYNDSEYYCTIGYGHLIEKERCEKIVIPQKFKNGITESEAEVLFAQRLLEFEKSVQRDIKVKLFQYEFDALVSLVFNSGPEFLNIGGKNKKETKIKININNEDYSGGADEFSDVTNGGTSGLIKRRKAEINMFKNNVYDSKH